MGRHLAALMTSTVLLAGFGTAASAQQSPSDSLLAPIPMMEAPAAQTQSPPNRQTPHQQQPLQQGDRETVGGSNRDQDDEGWGGYHSRHRMGDWMRDNDRRGWMHERDEDRGRGWMRDREHGWMRNEFGRPGPRGGMSGMMGPGAGGALVMRLMFALMDTDNDGTVSLQEFQAAHERIFKAMDANKDGVLTPEEVQNFFSGNRTAAPQSASPQIPTPQTPTQQNPSPQQNPLPVPQAPSSQP